MGGNKGDQGGSDCLSIDKATLKDALTKVLSKLPNIEELATEIT